MKNYWVQVEYRLIKIAFRFKPLKRFLLLLTIVSGIGVSAFAAEPDLQQFTVTGVVTDSQTGDFMPGVNVVVKGATVGTITDESGKYSISVSDRNATLVFSFIGYVSKEVSVAGKSVIDVVLLSDMQNLEEVVVVGYGTQRRVTVTGSVASVNSKEIAKTPTNNITNAIAGLLPGVITKNTSGEPGRDDNVVLIREEILRAILTRLL